MLRCIILQAPSGNCDYKPSSRLWTMFGKVLGSLLCVSLLAGEVVAQVSRSESLRDELRNELGQLYNQSGGEALDREELEKARREALAEDAAIDAEIGVVVASRNTGYVERRPKVVVESSPLDESKAARMRRQREEFEAQTEMKIVEKLEQDRIEAEQERARRLFGDKLQRQAEAPVHPVQPIVVAPVRSRAEQDLEREDFKQDLREVITELKTVHKEDVDVEEIELAPTYYVMPSFGVGSYPGINNVRGVYTLGVGLGAEYVNGLMLEGAFHFSSYDLFDCFGPGACSFALSQNNLLEMRQYSLGLNLKYQFNSAGRLRPIVGGVAALNMREYEQTFGGGRAQNISSNALDLGLMAGVAIEVSKMWSVVADIRYMFNVTNRIEDTGFNASFQARAANGSPVIEELDYTLFNIGLKFKF